MTIFTALFRELWKGAYVLSMSGVITLEDLGRETGPEGHRL